MHYGQFCPIAKATEILGERWTILILRELLMGREQLALAIETMWKIHELCSLFLTVLDVVRPALTRAAPGPRRESMSSACSFSRHNASLHMPSSMRPTGPRASRRAR